MVKHRKKWSSTRTKVDGKMLHKMRTMRLFGASNYEIAEKFKLSYLTVLRYMGKAPLANRKTVDMTLKKSSGRTTVGYTEYPTETLNSHNSMMASIGEVVMQNIVVWGVMTIIICLCLILIPWAMLSVRMIIGH